MSDQNESVEDFRARAKAWLEAGGLPKRKDPDAHEVRAAGEPEHETDGLEIWERNRELQKTLFAGGFAGICFPKEYGGQGLSRAHQLAFDDLTVEYEMPLLLNVPSLSICSAMILDMGTEEQKQKYVRGAISGELILCQFLSEPSGGSDLAGLLTRAQRDGDTYVINGQKTWSTNAFAADYATCLVRTDWDAPKHRGLSMIIVPVHDPATHLNRFRMVNGANEFCEEFFQDLVVPAENLVGTENDGWTVGQRQLFYERQAVGGGSAYSSGRAPDRGSRSGLSIEELARSVGKDKDPATRELVGWAHAQDTVNHQLIKRITIGMTSGEYPAMASTMMRLAHAEIPQQKMDMMLDIAGDQAVTGVPEGDGFLKSVGVSYLMRQGASLGGGSSEMSRNMISERVLMMPREYAADRDVPFKDVRRGR
ncbi:MAG: acyl-CoA dehydrogenase family protein [Actinomycetota bacterium]|nr:acyl-CoA dehydrogenase family protein [Actinomycetota bacterium]